MLIQCTSKEHILSWFFIFLLLLATNYSTFTRLMRLFINLHFRFLHLFGYTYWVNLKTFINKNIFGSKQLDWAQSKKESPSVCWKTLVSPSFVRKGWIEAHAWNRPPPPISSQLLSHLSYNTPACPLLWEFSSPSCILYKVNSFHKSEGEMWFFFNLFSVYEFKNKLSFACMLSNLILSL